MKNVNIKKGLPWQFLTLISIFSLHPGFLFSQSPCDFSYTLLSNDGLVQFTNSFTSDCIEYEKWVLGDGTEIQEVSNPQHLYLSAGINGGGFNVTHIVQYQGSTYTCVQAVSVPVSPNNSLCSDRYFSYDVDGCTLDLVSTISNYTLAPVDVTISFGDDSPPVYDLSTTQHSYSNPGTYTVSQSYILYDDQGNIIGQGNCTRPVTVGCCCTSDPQIDITFDMPSAGCGTHSVKVSTGACCESNKCQAFSVKVGGNDAFIIDPPCGSTTFCITNYSTYAPGDDGFITVKYSSFCHGQPVTKVVQVKPPFEGIYLGLDPTDPYNCDPDNNAPSNNGGGYFSGSPNQGCKNYYSFLSDYETSLPGIALATNQGAPNYNVFVAPNSIIQVNKSFSFIGNVNIYMGANSGWDVLSIPNTNTGRVLEIKDGVKMGENACCLWRGIRLYGNGRFIAQSGTSKPDNTVANALYAVQMLSIQSRSPFLSTRNTIYNNNFISIRGTNGRFTINSSAFRQNTFTSSGLTCIDDCLKEQIDLIGADQYMVGNRSYAGMFIQGGGAPAAGVINLTQVSFAPVLFNEENKFINLANGVIARNLTFSMQDCASFYDINPGNYSPGINGYGVRWSDNSGSSDLTFLGLTVNANPLFIDQTTFNNCTAGIRAENYVPGIPSNVDIRGCGMTDVDFGIILDANMGALTGDLANNRISSNQIGVYFIDQIPGTSSNLQISDNIINGSGAGISVEGNDLSGALQVDIGPNNLIDNLDGILVNSYSRSYIHENTVTGNGTGTGIFAVGGTSEIECNNISGKATGIFVLNNIIHKDLSFNNISNCPDGGMSIIGACPADNLIECNTFNNNSLIYSSMAITGDQYNTGNTWNNSSASADGSVQTNLSEYTVPTGTGPSSVTPPLNWFFYDGNLNLPQCSQICMPDFIGGGGGGHQLDESIAADNTSVPEWMKWKMDSYLYRKLYEDPALEASNVLYQNFTSSKAGTTIGQLGNIRIGANQLFYPGQNEQMIEANKVQIRLLQDELNALNEQISPDVDEALLGAIYTEMNDISEDIAGLININNGLIELSRQNRHSGAQNLATELSNIEAGKSWEINEKTVLGIYLGTVAMDVIPDAVQLNSLYEVAVQCPETGGNIVYFAKSLWESFTEQEVATSNCDTEQNKAGSDRGKFTTSDNGLMMELYPNPTNDFLNLLINENQTVNRWEIFNMFGQLISSQSGAFTGTVRISVSGLPDGVYQIKVISTNGNKQSESFIVKH